MTRVRTLGVLAFVILAMSVAATACGGDADTTSTGDDSAGDGERASDQRDENDGEITLVIDDETYIVSVNGENEVCEISDNEINAGGYTNDRSGSTVGIHLSLYSREYSHISVSDRMGEVVWTADADSVGEIIADGRFVTMEADFVDPRSVYSSATEGTVSLTCP